MPADRGRPDGRLQRVPDQRRHHRERHRGRLREDPPLVLEGVDGVGVVAVDRRLVVSADHERRRPQHGQRPERRHLRAGQRPDGVERAHGRQHRAGLGARVVQHRGDRDGRLGHRPRRGQVAEVDEPVRLPTGAHHVVVGDVEVHGLVRQLPGHRLDRGPGRGRGRLHLGALAGIGDVRREPGDHLRGVAQVPLQRAVQAGMAEPGQGDARPPGHLPQPGDDHRGQVPGPGERASGQVAQHPGDPRTVRARHHRPQRAPRRPAPQGGDAQVRAGPGELVGRGVLRGDLLLAEHRVGDLEHADRVAAVEQQQVGVLLAAQCPRGDAPAELLLDEPARFRLGHRRRGTDRVAEEVEADGHAAHRKAPGTPPGPSTRCGRARMGRCGPG